MKTLLSALLAVCVATAALAEPTAAEVGSPKRTPEELRKLLAPIALYPDSLIALILPASTTSSDVVLAARYFESGGDPSGLDLQSWDESVRNLGRYPGILKWMDENLEWTRELGETFVAQPGDVMNMIQTLRTEARANGLLKDTPEQKVVVRNEEITIVPANPEVIYVPYYDPEIIFLNRPRHDVWLTYSVGFPIGSWLYYDLDWSRHTVWKYRRPPGWVYRPDWRWHHPHRPIHTYCDEWRPRHNHWSHHRRSHRPEYRQGHVPHVSSPRGVIDVPPTHWTHRDRGRMERRHHEDRPVRGAGTVPNRMRRGEDRVHPRGQVERQRRPASELPSGAVVPTAQPTTVDRPDRANHWRRIREREQTMDRPPRESPRIPHAGGSLPHPRSVTPMQVGPRNDPPSMPREQYRAPRHTERVHTVEPAARSTPPPSAPRRENPRTESNNDSSRRVDPSAASRVLRGAR